MTKKEKLALAKELNEIAADIRRTLFYDQPLIAKAVETHQKQLRRAKEIISSLEMFFIVESLKFQKND